jgi:GTP-binding protein
LIPATVRNPSIWNLWNGSVSSQIPFSIVFTKTDKLKPEELEVNIKNYEAKLLETWETVPPCLLSSAEKGKGREEILQYIAKINTSNQKL